MATAKRSPRESLVALVLLAGFSISAQAQVYKCTTAGKIAYQDRPCAHGGVEVQVRSSSHDPGTRRTDETASRPVRESGDLAEANRQIRAADDDSRRLHAEYDQDVISLRARAQHMSTAQADVAIRALNSAWQPRFEAAHRRENDLSDALHARCPGGAMLNANTQTCLP